MRTLQSQIDTSVNFVFPQEQGALESRYVKRRPDDIICYLSVANGCNQSCRFCHLTQTAQVYNDHASIQQILHQAKAVLEYAKNDGKLDGVVTVYFSFMARGEPLNSPVLYEESKWFLLKNALRKLASRYGLSSAYKISTILPRKSTIVGNPLLHLVWSDTTVYYSLYSVDHVFRKTWLPKAGSIYTALAWLAEYKQAGGKLVLHWALIDGHNDRSGDINAIRYALHDYGLQDTRINIVRYNTHNVDKTSDESNRFSACVNQLRVVLPHVYVVDRVGQDVYASCGMFVCEV